MLKKYFEKLKNTGELYLRVKVRTKSSVNAIKEILDDDTFKIDICAEPIKGKANKEIVKFLASVFSVEKNNVKIISGVADKIKLIKIIC